MNKIYFCTNFIKVLICLLLIGTIISFFNLDGSVIKIINTKTYQVQIANNNTEIEIGERKYTETSYHITLDYIDIIINEKQDTENGQESIQVKRMNYSKQSPIDTYFKTFLKQYKAYIGLTFILFQIIIISFFIPTKNKIKQKHIQKIKLSSIYRFKLSIYATMVLIYMPIFILMMILITKDFKQLLIDESIQGENQIIKSICLDVNQIEFGYCKKYDYHTTHIENEFLKDYDIIISNNTKTSFVSYNWQNGPINIKLLFSYFQLLGVYILIVVLILYEYHTKKIKKSTSNPYM